MKCEKCNDNNTSVIGGYIAANGMRRRRRKCNACQHKFSTMEITYGHLAGIKQAIETMKMLYKEFGKFKIKTKKGKI